MQIPYSLCFAMLLLGTIANLPAVPPREPLPDLDRRAAKAAAAAAAVPGVEALRARLPHAAVDWAPVVGSPRWIASRHGFLTGPDGEGGAVTRAFRAKHRDDDPHRAVKAFLDEHPVLFGHDSAGWANDKSGQTTIGSAPAAKNGGRSLRHWSLVIFPPSTFRLRSGSTWSILWSLLWPLQPNICLRIRPVSCLCPAPKWTRGDGIT